MRNYSNTEIEYEISMCEDRIHRLRDRIQGVPLSSYRQQEIAQLTARLADESIQLANWQNQLTLDDETIEPLVDSSPNHEASPLHSKPSRRKTKTEDNARWARMDAMNQEEPKSRFNFSFTLFNITFTLGS